MHLRFGHCTNLTQPSSVGTASATRARLLLLRGGRGGTISPSRTPALPPSGLPEPQLAHLDKAADAERVGDHEDEHGHQAVDHHLHEDLPGVEPHGHRLVVEERHDAVDVDVGAGHEDQVVAEEEDEGAVDDGDAPARPLDAAPCLGLKGEVDDDEAIDGHAHAQVDGHVAADEEEEVEELTLDEMVEGEVPAPVGAGPQIIPVWQLVPQQDGVRDGQG